MVNDSALVDTELATVRLPAALGTTLTEFTLEGSNGISSLKAG